MHITGGLRSSCLEGRRGLGRRRVSRTPTPTDTTGTFHSLAATQQAKLLVEKCPKVSLCLTHLKGSSRNLLVLHRQLFPAPAGIMATITKISHQNQDHKDLRGPGQCYCPGGSHTSSVCGVLDVTAEILKPCTRLTNRRASCCSCPTR